MDIINKRILRSKVLKEPKRKVRILNFMWPVRKQMAKLLGWEKEKNKLKRQPIHETHHGNSDVSVMHIMM